VEAVILLLLLLGEGRHGRRSLLARVGVRKEHRRGMHHVLREGKRLGLLLVQVRWHSHLHRLWLSLTFLLLRALLELWLQDRYTLKFDLP